jgi:hypothetical protein
MQRRWLHARNPRLSLDGDGRGGHAVRSYCIPRMVFWAWRDGMQLPAGRSRCLLLRGGFSFVAEVLALEGFHVTVMVRVVRGEDVGAVVSGDEVEVRGLRGGGGGAEGGQARVGDGTGGGGRGTGTCCTGVDLEFGFADIAIPAVGELEGVRVVSAVFAATKAKRPKSRRMSALDWRGRRGAKPVTSGVTGRRSRVRRDHSLYTLSNNQLTTTSL